MEEYTIGMLAKASGVGVETIRFYERKGLIEQPPKAETRRRYPADGIRRIRFIKRAQDLGFTLREIKDLLGLNADPKARCSDVKAHTDQKLQEVKDKIKDLQKMKKSLERLSTTCGKGKHALAQCRILDCLEGNCQCV